MYDPRGVVMRPQFASPVAPLTAGDVGARKGSPVAAAALREGSADLDGSVVEGVVLPRNIPGGAVLRVDIEQHGTQQWDSERRCWSHRWSERARRIRAEPFELQLDSGAVVRVLVCDDVEFEGDLAGIIRAGPTTRVRVAELQPGVRAYVFGVLRGGGAPGIHPYRHGEEESLERPKHGRMRIAIRPPTPDFSKRAAPGFRKAGWIASVFAGLALSLCTYILPPAE